MHLSQHSLRQLDQAYLDSLGEAEVRALSGKLLDDLKNSLDQMCIRDMCSPSAPPPTA